MAVDSLFFCDEITDARSSSRRRTLIPPFREGNNPAPQSLEQR